MTVIQDVGVYTMPAHLRTIVFDLDGTLYVNEQLAAEIQQAVSTYIAQVRQIPLTASSLLIKETRQRLTHERGTEATLSSVCTELGGTVADFHRTATQLVHPERWLDADIRVITLLTDLAQRFELVIYTNNNRTLAERILTRLGISGLFRHIVTIEDFWLPKPDRSALMLLLKTIGRSPGECLFVGDRYDVDLRLPAELGCAVHQVADSTDLLALASLAELA
jgi:putative hydrolase of the HAD superfamily